MEDLLLRDTWNRQDDEDALKFASRIKLQTNHLAALHKSRGRCFMIKFGVDEKTGIDDSRPMWENEIDIKALQHGLKSPLGVTYHCPLCQPYDAQESIMDIEKNRRYMCKIVNPLYAGGAIDEEGVYMKCVCIMKPAQKARLKFKKG